MEYSESMYVCIVHMTIFVDNGYLGDVIYSVLMCPGAMAIALMGSSWMACSISEDISTQLVGRATEARGAMARDTAKASTHTVRRSSLFPSLTNEEK